MRNDPGYFLRSSAVPTDFEAYAVMRRNQGGAALDTTPVGRVILSDFLKITLALHWTRGNP